jgi:DNA primase
MGLPAVTPPATPEARRGRISEASIDAVLGRTDIVDLVSGYTQLRKAGAEFTGRCPFHEERTPSFWVNATKGVYHCFGCGASGNVIGFLRDKQGLDFVEAVEYLADRYRITLEYDEPSGGGAAAGPRIDRRRVYELLETATSFYEAYLWKSSEAAPAREYLRSRGVTEETARAFRMGYSPEAATATAPRARAKGYTDEELKAAGLVGGRGGDFFRGRLMVPIIDRAGRVIGFGARKLREEQYGGKYVNSPDGPVFKKSRSVFTPPGVREAAQAAGSIVVVEGYMDVIAMYQAGMGNACAAMGTSLTEEQVTELKRLAPKAFFAFDPDAAGQMAALRALAKAREQQLDVRVTLLHDGDPADVLAMPDGSAQLQQALDHSVTLLHYRVSALLGAADLSDGPGRDRAYEEAAKLFAELPAGPERSEQVQRVAGVLRLTPDLAGRLEGSVLGTAPAPTGGGDRRPNRGDHRGGSHAPAPATSPAPLVVKPEESVEARDERTLLSGFVRAADTGRIELAPMLEAMSVEWFASPAHRAVFEALAAGTVDELRDRAVSEHPELVPLLTGLADSRDAANLGVPRELDMAALRTLQARVEAHYVDRTIERLQAELRSHEDDEVAFDELRRMIARKRELRAADRV